MATGWGSYGLAMDEAGSVVGASVGMGVLILFALCIVAVSAAASGNSVK